MLIGSAAARAGSSANERYRLWFNSNGDAVVLMGNVNSSAPITLNAIRFDSITTTNIAAHGLYARHLGTGNVNITLAAGAITTGSPLPAVPRPQCQSQGCVSFFIPLILLPIGSDHHDMIGILSEAKHFLRLDGDLFGEGLTVLNLFNRTPHQLRRLRFR